MRRVRRRVSVVRRMNVRTRPLQSRQAVILVCCGVVLAACTRDFPSE